MPSLNQPLIMAIARTYRIDGKVIVEGVLEKGNIDIGKVHTIIWFM